MADDKTKDEKVVETKTETPAAEPKAAAEEAKSEPAAAPATEDTKVAAPSKETSAKPVPAKFKDLVKQVETMRVLELSELVKALEERFGVSAAAPMAVAAAPTAGSEGAADTDEGKKEFNVFLKETGDKKIDVIKAVREISGLGLAESKAIVDSAPKMVKENVAKDDAEEAMKKLEAAGATVELQ
ncbi:50S ribosomal protein L7/L12 [Candidatus Microgenomates bacterium]|nr:50S ribosomal protein L7/L12 [Candidatus Microgenomates bacterium]